MTSSPSETAVHKPYDEPQTWYFTFGIGIDQPNRNSYYVVRDATGEAARDRMNEVFAVEWGHEFPAEVDSLWTSAEEAQKRLDELEAKGLDGYRVRPWQPREKWEPES